MEYAKYRSKSLKLLWPRVLAELNMPSEAVIRLQSFSTWEVDNICANNWKVINPLQVCADMLFDYVQTILSI